MACLPDASRFVTREMKSNMHYGLRANVGMRYAKPWSYDRHAMLSLRMGASNMPFWVAIGTLIVVTRNYVRLTDTRTDEKIPKVLNSNSREVFPMVTFLMSVFCLFFVDNNFLALRLDKDHAVFISPYYTKSRLKVAMHIWNISTYVDVVFKTD